MCPFTSESVCDCCDSDSNIVACECAVFVEPPHTKPPTTTMTSDRWLTYFENHAYDVDAEWYHARLVKKAARLLGDVTSMTATSCSRIEGGPASGGYYTNNISTGMGSGDVSTAVKQLLDAVKPTNQNIFLTIQPTISFAKLPICWEMLWHLVSRLSIFPGFLDVLHLFGGKTDEVNEDYAVYRQHFTPASDGGSDGAREETFELCYNFKYVEQRPSHADGHHPIWTTRKIGVYAKREPKESRTTWVLIQPGRKSYLDRVTKRLGKAGKAHAHDQEIHLLLMKSASQNWTEHIDALDVEFRMLDTKVFMWRPGVTNALVDEYLQSGLVMPDSQRIQHYKVKLHQLLHALDINYANIESLRRGMEEFQRQGNYTSRDEHQKYDRELQELLFQTMQHKVRVMHLIECAQGLLSLVCTLIPYVFARKENSLMLKLSEKATEYAKSMNMITIMCMLYLPPSLVAAIFGMTDIFHTRSSSLGPVIGMFAAATTGLFALTFTVWALWEYTRRNFSSLRDEEMNVTD